MEKYVQVVYSHQNDESDTTGIGNENKLVVARTSKKKITSSQFTTLVGGDEEFKQYVKSMDLKNPQEGIDLVMCEVSFAKSSNEEIGKQCLQKFDEEISNAKSKFDH